VWSSRARKGTDRREGGNIHYAFTFFVSLEHAECGFTRGDFGEAPSIVSSILPASTTKLDVATIHRKGELQVVGPKYKEPPKLALAPMLSFTGDLSAHLDWDEVQQEFRSVWNNLKERPGEVFDLPAIAIRGPKHVQRAVSRLSRCATSPQAPPAIAVSAIAA